MKKLKIKKGARVEVISGADRGKQGTVLDVEPNTLKVRVQGVRVQTHFDKKDGLKELEVLIDYSNVKLIEQAPEKKSKAKKKSSKTA
ncbi:MAG: KOW motif-containing protein [Bdellovibrionales bacterium]|nr:KOW motif-containing protein [Bdellovibrionales bacterium]